MTVAELITKLRELPQDLPVYCMTEENWIVYPVMKVTVNKPGTFTSATYDSDHVLFLGELS